MISPKALVASHLYPVLRGPADQAEARAEVLVHAAEAAGVEPTAYLASAYIGEEGTVGTSAHMIAARIKASGRYDYRPVVRSPFRVLLEFFAKGDSAGSYWAVRCAGPCGLLEERSGVGERPEVCRGCRAPVVVTETPIGWRWRGDADWHLERARAAGVVSGAAWKDALTCLWVRAISEGARHHCPDLFSGAVYADGEVPEAPEAAQAPGNDRLDAVLPDRNNRHAPKGEWQKLGEKPMRVQFAQAKEDAAHATPPAPSDAPIEVALGLAQGDGLPVSRVVVYSGSRTVDSAHGNCRISLDLPTQPAEAHPQATPTEENVSTAATIQASPADSPNSPGESPHSPTPVGTAGLVASPQNHVGHEGTTHYDGDDCPPAQQRADWNRCPKCDELVDQDGDGAFPGSRSSCHACGLELVAELMSDGRWALLVEFPSADGGVCGIHEEPLAQNEDNEWCCTSCLMAEAKAAKVERPVPPAVLAESVEDQRRVRAAKWSYRPRTKARKTKGPCVACSQDVEGGDFYRAMPPGELMHDDCVTELAAGRDPRAAEGVTT